MHTPLFSILKQILLALREDAFMIGPAGSSVREEKEKLVYPTRVEYEEYLQGADEPQFFLGIQPLELYMQGHRDDWGIVASESYNIAIIGYRSEEAAMAFRGHFVDDPEMIRKSYLPTTPEECQCRFEANYLSNAHAS